MLLTSAAPALMPPPTLANPLTQPVVGVPGIGQGSPAWPAHWRQAAADAPCPGWRCAGAGYVDAATDLPPIPRSFPKLGQLRKPDFKQFTLRNGLRVVLLEDHEALLVNGLLLMKGGQRASPPDKVGLATLAAGVQRAGGTVALPGDALDDALEALGASLEASAGEDSTSVGFEALAEDAGRLVALAADLVAAPALGQEQLQVYRAQVLNSLEHQYDSPSAIPRRQLPKLLYGRDSVYGRTATTAQVAGITREDLVEYLATWQRPDTAVLGIWGDFDAPAMRTLVEDAFGGWAPASGQPAQPPPLPATPIPEPAWAPGTVFLVDRPGLTQAAVGMGELGISVTDRDIYALSVLNGILNGFGGTLFDEVRSRQGLAYTVSAGWGSTPIDHPGLFLASGQTARPSEFIVAVQRVLADATAAPPGREALAAAKDESLNSFVFNYATPGQQMARVVTYQLLGLPEDFLFQYRRGLERVAASDVVAAAARRLHPRQQAVVVVADAAVARGQLEAAGFTVVPLELGDP